MRFKLIAAVFLALVGLTSCQTGGGGGGTGGPGYSG